MSEEDEIYSVARLLGDLVAYRASGTGHLELLAGLFWNHAVPYHVMLVWCFMVATIHILYIFKAGICAPSILCT